jgi:hypothetical protein
MWLPVVDGKTMTPFGVNCQHQMVNVRLAVKKSRLRWDYKRSAWRHVAYSGAVTLMWYKRCAACGQMRDHLGPGNSMCHSCRNKQYRLLGSISGPAHRKVQKAIRAGSLAKLDGSVQCVDCGASAAIYDHREYARPLDVDPVCRRCNVRRGPAKETAGLVWRRRRLC